MIYGERIRFRHAEKTDLPAFVTWLNDPEVRAAMLARPGLWARLKRWVRSMLEKAGFGSDTDRLRTAVLKVWRHPSHAQCLLEGQDRTQQTKGHIDHAEIGRSGSPRAMRSILRFAVSPEP